jgi:glutamate dehydrogenase (NADP+)
VWLNCKYALHSLSSGNFKSQDAPCSRKAANAARSYSGLEMTQNSMRLGWNRTEVDARLHEIMKNIHAACRNNGKEADGYVNYVKGANIAGFLKVANAMCDQGLV